MKRFVVLALSLGVCLAGCPDAPKPVVFDAGSPVADAGDLIDAGTADDAGLPHRLLKYDVAGTLIDGGATVIELAPDSMPTETDALKGLSIASVALRDYRIRVIDSADQVVPSDDTATELDGGLLYVIAFTQPLKAGKSYALTFEAQNGSQLTDSSGNPWDDVRVMLKIRGEPEPESGKPAKKKKKR